MKALTVNKLWKLCVEAKKNGLGGKYVLLSNDDEWNGFHELFDGFTPTGDVELQYFNTPTGLAEDEIKSKYVILG